MQEDFNFRTDTGAMLIDFNAQHYHSQDTRHTEDVFTKVENQVCGRQSDGDFNHGVVKDVLKPENHELAWDQTQGHTAECDTREIKTDLSS